MSKVSVSARIRGVAAPSNSGGTASDAIEEGTIKKIDNKKLSVSNGENTNTNINTNDDENNNQTGLTFELDHIFGDSCSQVELFDELVKPIIADALTGFNATIFTYGQTGSGKVCTMYDMDIYI